MRTLHFISMALLGCATTPMYLPAPGDTHCGNVGPVEVDLTPGVEQWPPLMTCREALGYVSGALADVPIRGPLLVKVSAYDIWWFDGAELKWKSIPGITYPEPRRVIIRADSPWALEHEFWHAQDFERGRGVARK